MDIWIKSNPVKAVIIAVVVTALIVLSMGAVLIVIVIISQVMKEKTMIRKQKEEKTKLESEQNRIREIRKKRMVMQVNIEEKEKEIKRDELLIADKQEVLHKQQYYDVLYTGDAPQEEIKKAKERIKRNKNEIKELHKSIGSHILL